MVQSVTARRRSGPGSGEGGSGKPTAGLPSARRGRDRTGIDPPGAGGRAALDRPEGTGTACAGKGQGAPSLARWSPSPRSLHRYSRIRQRAAIAGVYAPWGSALVLKPLELGTTAHRFAVG